MPEEFEFCRPYLGNGEYILWKGKPEPGFSLTPGEKGEMLMGLLFCGVGPLWLVLPAEEVSFLYRLLFASLFLGVGLFTLIVRPLWTLWIRRHTAYVITNKKILRRQGKKVDMLEGRSMPTARWALHKNGNGTVQFGSQSFKAYDTFGRGRTYVNRNLFTLHNLADVRGAQQALQNIER